MTDERNAALAAMAADAAAVARMRAEDALRPPRPWLWIAGRQLELVNHRPASACVHGRATDDRCEGCSIAFQRGDVPGGVT